MHYVASSDVIFVDARGKRGLGVGAEIMWAKMHKIPVIAWAPKDTHYNRKISIVLGIPEFIHPFVDVSDLIVENIDEGADWIKKYIEEPNLVKIKGIEEIQSAIAYFKHS